MADNLDDNFAEEEESLDEDMVFGEDEPYDEGDEEDSEEVGLEFEEFPGEEFVEDLESDFDDDDDILVDDIGEHDDIDEILENGPVIEPKLISPKVIAPRSDDEDEDEDEEEDEDDIEASLDDILKERLVVLDDEDEDEDEDLEDSDYRTDIALRVLPKQPDEFVCQSCFLVKNRSQIADKEKMFCRDCV